MRVLVIGGTGKVGSALVQELATAGVEVRALSRSGRAPDRPGVEGVSADLSQPDTLPRAFEGVDRCYLLTPLAQDETGMGWNAVAAAREAKVDRLVFQSVAHAAEYPAIPHFASKMRILERIRDSGLSWTVVAPTSFYQNDVAIRPLILGPGIYPNPIGSGGINRVDVRDIARVAAALLRDSGYEGRELPVVGPDTWTGDSIAALYTEVLGRKVRYPGDDLDAWAANARAFLPQWLIHDLRIMFETFQEQGLPASAEELAETREILGREPRAFRDFARELVGGV